MQHDIPIYVIDDEPDIRRSLEIFLGADSREVLTFASPGDFLDLLAELPPGIVISDLRMPGMDGLSLIQALHDRQRDDPVIVVTGHADVPLAVQALKAGAVDLIEKPITMGAITAAVGMASGQSRLQTRVLLESLTRRELEVFGYLIDGATNKRIGLALGISPRTVEIYRANLMEKMRASNLSRLIRMGIEVGLGGKDDR